MSYDPIIHFYDDPGHPYWPSKNGSSGGGGTERVKLFEETVTTEDEGGYATAILAFTGDTDADPLVVTFDGTEYELPMSEVETLMGKTVTYGTPLTEGVPDFSTYPLVLVKNSAGWMAYTETAGTHTIVAYADSATPTPTLGPLQPWPHKITSAPVVGDTLGVNSYLAVERLLLGNMIVCAKIYPLSNDPLDLQVASGMTIASNGLSAAKFYAVTFGSETDDGYPYTSVRQLDVEMGNSGGDTTFVMPDLTANDETLVIASNYIG